MRGILRVIAAAALFALGVVPRAAAQTTEYYTLDAIGSVRVITDQTGAVIERHDYLPFGEEWNPTTSNDARKFTGKERDTETGYDYFGARYLSSKVGRFTALDPSFIVADNLVDPQRWNRYTYSRDNPLRYVDPDGRVIFDYQEFRAYVGEALKFGQEGHGYLVPTVAGLAAAGSIANDVSLGGGRRRLANDSRRRREMRLVQRMTCVCFVVQRRLARQGRRSHKSTTPSRRAAGATTR